MSILRQGAPLAGLVEDRKDGGAPVQEYFQYAAPLNLKIRPNALFHLHGAALRWQLLLGEAAAAQAQGRAAPVIQAPERAARCGSCND